MIQYKNSIQNTLPYEKPVDYVYSDGKSCIIIPHIHQNEHNSKIISEWKMLDGYYFHNRNLFQGTLADYNGIGGTYDYNVYAANEVIVNCLSSFNCVGIHHLEITTRKGQLHVNADGNEFTTKLSDSNYIAKTKMGVLTQNDSPNIAIVKGRCPIKCGCRSFKYWDGDNLVADLVPVLIEKDMYGFYNNVDKQLIYNAVEDSRLLGPEVSV